MGRMRTAAPALVALGAALIAGCGSSQSGSASKTSPGLTKTVTRTVTAAHGSGSASSAGSSSSKSANTTGAGAGTGTMKSSTSRASICRAADVKLVYLGGQGATGHGLLGFAIRNTGSARCTTVGYPGIQFVSKSGAPLPTHPRHTTDDFFGKTTYAPVTVAPGKTASFRLGVTHGLASPKGCVTAASVQVIVPNDTTRLRVRIPNGVYECRGIVTVSPMQPGDSAYHPG